jgi:hypothetical protein
MKKLSFIFLIMLTSLKTYSQNLDSMVFSIYNKVAEINSSLGSCKLIEKTIIGESTEGAGLEGYFKEAELVKNNMDWYGEGGHLMREYYLFNNNIIFIRDSDFTYNVPFRHTEKDSDLISDEVFDDSKTKIYIKAYYFDKSKIIRFIENGQIGKLDIKNLKALESESINDLRKFKKYLKMRKKEIFAKSFNDL